MSGVVPQQNVELRFTVHRDCCVACEHLSVAAYVEGTLHYCRKKVKGAWWQNNITGPSFSICDLFSSKEGLLGNSAVPNP